MAARSKARTVFDPSDTGIVGSIPARSMVVCPPFLCVMLFCMRWADPPYKESYQVSKQIHKYRL